MNNKKMVSVPRDELERTIQVLRYAAHPLSSPHADHWEEFLLAAPVDEPPAKLNFPTMLRKMWSGGEVQRWLNEQGPLYRHPAEQPAPMDQSEMAALREELAESDSVVTKVSELLAGVAVAVRGPELERHRHGYHDLPERVIELQQRLTAAEQRNAVLVQQASKAFESAAKWVESRRDDYVIDHGSLDPETGSVEFPRNGEEYVGELDEIAEGLRNLKPTESGATPPEGWKLVPIRPTAEMLKAVDDEADDKHLARGRAISAWVTMMDAAPAAPQQTTPSEDQPQYRRGTVMPEETVLIQPLPVERDTSGWWSHPEYLSEHDDEITEAQFNDWCARHQLETKITHMESDVPAEVFDAYMNDGQCDCSAWEIQYPAEPGWFILSIHDAEDGPVCIWGRRLAP